MTTIFEKHYVFHPEIKTIFGDVSSGEFQSCSKGMLKNPILEITANGIPDKLKTHFSYPLFEQLAVDNLHPDIMGFVRKREKSETEYITIEIKKDALTLRDLMQAKLYETFFQSKHSFLLSPTGISPERMSLILKYDKDLRGNVIIGECGDDGKTIWFNHNLVDKVTKEFKKLCR
jgi:hypothetical protein